MPTFNQLYGGVPQLLPALATSAVVRRERQETEAFIQRVFRCQYDAQVTDFLPLLLRLLDADSRPMAALGLGPAGPAPLFLEHYLPLPVQTMLSRATGNDIDRGSIIEVGNLALAGRGGARELIGWLTVILFAVRFDWVVFTIGPVLANSFRRLGLPLLDLGPATAADLPAAQRGNWGTYYEQGPRVMAGRLADAELFVQQQNVPRGMLLRLWQQVPHVGERAA
jgi:hypothetical protein